MKRIPSAVAAALLGLAVVGSAGCVRVEMPDDHARSSNERIETQGATAIDAGIDLAAGELTVSRGESDAFEGDFEYPSENWRPEVAYEVSDGTGELSVKTPDNPGFDLPFRTRTPYAWDVRLPAGVPLDLAVNIGAGAADLDLRGLDLRELGVDLGAGDTTIDLSGEWANDLPASIEAGAGQLTLRVPTDVGVRIVGYRDGLGEYSANGFKQDGDALVNDAWENATVKFDIVLRRGVGKATIEMVD